jgi:tetratricopeptide (TPR) repeat protein
MLMRMNLLQNKPFAANQMLFQEQDSFQDQSSLSIAGFLGSYSRYLGSELPEARRNESYRLVTSLSDLNQEESLSTIDRYLLARAYQTLGFDENAMRHLQRALADETGEYWQNRILFELAMLHRSRQDNDEAVQRFEYLAKSSDLELAVSSQIQLLNILLERRQFPEAISKARDLLESKLNTDQQRQVLTSMGFAYRQTGEPYAAALCFAGMIPQQNPQQ